MLMIFVDEAGVRTEAILLSADKTSLRVVARGGDDTMELRRINGAWETEAGKRLEIEAVSVTPTVADGIVAIEMPLPVPKAVAATNWLG